MSAETGGCSRPCKTNCAGQENREDETSTDEIEVEKKEKIPPIVESFRESFPGLVNMAISTVPGARLRRECTREIRGGDGSLKSRVVEGVLRSFLEWYIEQEDLDLVFEGPDGETVKSPAPNSYSREYGEKHYGRLKDIEEQAVRDSPDLHTGMLSLTASGTDEDGMQRPPGEHLQGIQDTWSRYTRRELQRVMEGAGFERYDSSIDYELADAVGWALDDEEGAAKWWEYATVVEPHPGEGANGGYGHFHVAVFASHPIAEEMFHSVVDKHVSRCEYAGEEAHEYLSRGFDADVADGMVEVFGGEKIERPDTISENSVNPESEPEGQEIGNLGSYLSEYISGFSESLEDRPIQELVFQAVCWSQGRQRVRYSNGANELASEGRLYRAREGETEIPVSAPGWDVKAIEERHSGEKRPPAQKGSDYRVTILDGPPPD